MKIELLNEMSFLPLS